MTNYINAKIKILKFQSSKDHSYLNINNKFTKKIIVNYKKKKFFSKLHKVNKNKVKKIFKKIKNKYLLSQNNLENISFVLRIASNYRIGLNVVLQVLNKFKGLPHRQERLLLNDEIICINDSKATNFESSSQSLKIFWIVGGLPKKGDKFFLNKFKKNIIKAYIIGKSTIFFKKQLRKKVNSVVVNNLKNAVLKVIKDLKQIKNLNSLTKNKYTILFSPAAASFDQFENFENRGKKFKELVYRSRSSIY
jgi:UDP-N-acetylmuramoylalanine--D-glutamate ligase